MRGRPPAHLKPKGSERMILKALEQSPGTFTDLRERTKLADSTLSHYLKKLENQNLVEREYKRPNLLIKLSAKALDPVRRTIRHLEELVPPPSTLDVELGQKLLTKEVVDAMIEIYHTKFRHVFSPDDFSKISKLFGGTISVEPEFNEAVLLTVLAYYWCEKSFPSLLEPKSTRTATKPTYEPAVAVTPVLKNRGLVKQFDSLLKWADPLLKTPSMASGLFLRALIEHSSKLHDEQEKPKGGEK